VPLQNRHRVHDILIALGCTPTPELYPVNMSDPKAPVETHPRGTLAIVVIYGLLFVVGWAALYFLTYLPRGPVGP
jgi:hypothetical protein